MMQDIRHQYNKKMRKDREFKIRRDARKQTLTEVLKDLVIQEDLYEKDDKQKELLALYRFRIKLEQKIETMK